MWGIILVNVQLIEVLLTTSTQQVRRVPRGRFQPDTRDQNGGQCVKGSAAAYWGHVRTNELYDKQRGTTQEVTCDATHRCVSCNSTNRTAALYMRNSVVQEIAFWCQSKLQRPCIAPDV